MANTIFGDRNPLFCPPRAPRRADGAGFFQAKTRQLAATVGLDSFAKFRAEFFGRNSIVWRREALQQLKSKIGALGLRQRKSGFEKLVLRHAHGVIITGCDRRSKPFNLLCSGPFEIESQH
ncbi:MAG: hypothetical protein WD738_13750 [Pirellulales bacterium]